MTAMLNQAEYNRRLAIIEGLRWALSNGNNSVLWISEINHLWCCGKIYDFRTVQQGSNMPAKKDSHSKECSARIPAVDEKVFGWPKAIVARSDGFSEAVNGNCGVQKAICFTAGRCTGSYELFDSKLVLRQHRYVLVQGILAFQQPRFKFP